LEKVSIVLASANDEMVVTEFCAKHGIARSSLYSWRKALLISLAASVSPKKLSRRAG
jgi:transposase-like protein